MRRVVSLLLAVILCLSLIPAVHATDESDGGSLQLLVGACLGNKTEPGTWSPRSILTSVYCQDDKVVEDERNATSLAISASFGNVAGTV